MKTTSDDPPAAIRDQFWAKAGHLPGSEAEWAAQQETLRSWRGDPWFEVYWPLIDRLCGVDFAATRRWAAAAQAAEDLRQSGYDFDAWCQQRAYDSEHAEDHLP
jgi:hypothetical protein